MSDLYTSTKEMKMDPYAAWENLQKLVMTAHWQEAKEQARDRTLLHPESRSSRFGHRGIVTARHASHHFRRCGVRHRVRGLQFGIDIEFAFFAFHAAKPCG